MVKPELDNTKDYYKTLGIPTSSTQADIRKAFLDLARTQHPDKNPGQEIVFKAKFQIITTAYDVLKDPGLKRTYDQIRPVPRKPVSREKAAPAAERRSSQPPRSASESAKPAYPRQAKSQPKQASRTSPKKAPTARKDPFFDWIPPVPQRKPFHARPNATAPLNNASTSNQSAAKPESSKTDTARRSAFYHASPASPLNNNSDKSRPMPKTTSHNSNSKASSSETSIPTTTPDWSTKERWWEKSSTAYSTFHAPSSKYSPYTKEPPVMDPAQTAPVRKATFNGSTAPMDRAADGATCKDTKNYPLFASSAEYFWQRSQSAYQQTQPNSPPKKQVPRKPAFMEANHGGNPFFDSPRAAESRLETSSEGSEADEKEDEQLHASETSSESKDKESESSVSGDDNLGTRRQKIREHSSQRRMHQMPKRRVKVQASAFRRSTVESESDSDEPRGKPGIASRNTTTPSAADTEFVFKFNLPPDHTKEDVISSNSSQRIGLGVPYVKFNPIPDLDFSSPASGHVSTPFSASKNAGVFQNPAVQGEYSPSGSFSATKKHSRVEDRADPRYADDESNASTEKIAAKLADKFFTFGIHDTLPGGAQTSQAKPAAFATHSETVPSTTGKLSDVHMADLSEAPPSPRTFFEASIPTIPSILQHLPTEGDEFLPSRDEHLARGAAFATYIQAWQAFESHILCVSDNGFDSLPKEYDIALTHHEQVLSIHFQACTMQAKAMALWRARQNNND